MNNETFNSLFKSIFYEDFFNTKIEYDNEKLMHFDINSTLHNKSEFIFFVSTIILSRKLIKLNNPSLNEKNKHKYSLKEFCNDILNLDFAKSAFNSRPSIVGRVITNILSMNNDEFIQYSFKVLQNIEIKIRENIKLEEEEKNNYKTKNTKQQKIKISDVNDIL